MGKKADRARLGLYGLVSIFSSVGLILPAVYAIGYGWVLHRFFGYIGLAILLWLFAAVLLAESFNYWGTWKRGRTAMIRFLAAATFHVARLSGSAIYGYALVRSLADN